MTSFSFPRLLRRGTRPKRRASPRHWIILGAILGGACRSAPPDFAIDHVTIIDPGVTNPQGNMTVVVTGSRITAVAPSGSIDTRPGVRVVDGAGRYLIPGLWDMHVHALWDPTVVATFLPLFVANGVTGIRDMGGPLAPVLASRDSVRAGLILGPRIIAAGPILDGPEPIDPSISIAIGSAEAGTAAVDSLAAAGVDFIKVYTLLPRDAFFAIAQRAAELGLPMVGHVPAEVEVAEAAGAGLRSVEHLRSELGGLCDPYAAHDCATPFAAIQARGAWNTPTLSVRRNAALAYDERVVDTALLRYIPAVVRGFWEPARAAARERPEDEALRLAVRTSLERALASALHRAGLPLLAGSDAGDRFSFPGFTLHDELALLVEAGLSPREALSTATTEPAAFLRATDSLGAIVPGRIADLVLLDANPLEDIGNVRRIAAVVLNGTLLDRAALDDLLSQAEAAARKD